MFEAERTADGRLRIVGRLDAAQAPRAQAALDGLSGAPLVLDCSALDYISSAGLGVLLKTQKRLMASGGRLRLEGVRPHIRDILTFSGFDQLFELDAAP